MMDGAENLSIKAEETWPEVSLYRYRFGVVEFDEIRFELRVGGLIVEIEQKPLQVLAELLRHTDEVVTRDELFDAVWGGRTTVDHSLTSALAKLRKALGDGEEDRIVTLPRRGYRLVGPVERIAVGQRLASRLELKADAVVPGRPHFILHTQLSASRGSEVWKAQHAKTKEQRVFKFSLDGEHLAALKRETTLYRVLRESLGQRPDIARIVDWNFETPPFFLECEFAGENLVQWAGAEDRLARLSRDRRLALFLQIGDAVAAAHSVGVLHKDLKPANIMIAPRDDGEWQIRVIDFGSGRLMDPGVLVQLGITRQEPMDASSESMGLVSGTYSYIAPEVIAGQSSTVQSDIYALGVILFQLLTGDLKRPMASGWERAIGDHFLEEDIAAATDGNPAQRPASVGDLLNRLRGLDARREQQESTREIQARVVAAEKDSERARARRPWIVAAVASLAIGLILSILLYRGEKTARLEAEHQRFRAEEINRFLSDDLLGAADPSGVGGANNPTMKDVLAATAARLDSRFGDDPETKASIDLALSNAYFGMTDYADAEKHRRRAATLLTAARGAGDSTTLEATYALASILVQTNRLDEAETMLDSADRLAGARLTEHSELALKAHWARAFDYKLRMSPEKALSEYAAAELDRMAVEPTNDSLMLQLRDALSWCYERLGREEEAERILRDFMTAAYPPERVGPLYWAQARIEYGTALKVLGKNDMAEQVLTDGLRELRETLDGDHLFVAVIQNELADIYTRQARWQAAVDSLREAYRILCKRSGEHGQKTLIVAGNLGIVDYRLGQSVDAVQVLSSVHQDLVRQLGRASPQAASIAFYLACALIDIGRPNDAAELLPPLAATDLSAAEPRKDWEPRLEALRGAILAGQGHRSEGMAKLSSAIAKMEADGTPAEDLEPFKKMLRKLGE